MNYKTTNSFEAANQRDQIIFGEAYDKENYFGGIRRFDVLCLEQIEKLEQEGLLDLYARQNNSPAVGEIIEFLKSRETDGWYVHGYCVCPERADCRVSFEGVGKRTPPSKQDVIDFTEMFRFADEFRVSKDSLYCWYD